MDHADSGLFHVIEDSVRLQNAATLNLLAPGVTWTLPAEGTELTAAPAVETPFAHQKATPLVKGPTLKKQLQSQKGPAKATALPSKATKAASHAGEPRAVAFQGDKVEEVPLPARVEALLSHSDALDVITLAALATHRFSSEQAADPALDVLTGFHLTDGNIRVMLIEGLQGGALGGVLSDVLKWAQCDPEPIEKGTPRRVLYNKTLSYSHRAYPVLGAALWIVKLRTTLPKLLRQAATYAASKVRPECREGLHRVATLTTLTWARQIHELALWPTASMLQMIDKR